MDYRQLGSSGLRVPVFSFGTGAFAAPDAASAVLPSYPHSPCRQQEGFARLNPPLV